MAAPVRIIVHTGGHGLGEAVDYYTKFPWEPSPAGDMSLDKKNIVQVKDATLETVLQEMAKAGSGGTVLLVCHAYNDGLLMPVAKGALGSAGTEEIGHLLGVSAAQRKVKLIRAMPSGNAAEKKAKTDAWLELHRGITSKPLFGDDVTLEALERNYNQWLDDVAYDDLFLRGATRRDVLISLVQAMEKTQALKLERVELRACDIGRSSSAMSKVKQLFGCSKLLAPTVSTFYLKGVPVTTLKIFSHRYIAEHPVGNFRPPGPVGRTVKEPADFVIEVVRKNPGTRLFWDVEYGYIPPENPRPGPNKYDSGTSTIKLKRHVLAMLVEEVKKYYFRGSASTWDEAGPNQPQWENAQKFVKDFVMSKAAYKKGSLTLAGFWTPGESDPWLLPNEPEYVDHIKAV